MAVGDNNPNEVTVDQLVSELLANSLGILNGLQEGKSTVRYEGIDIPLELIYGELPEGASYYEVRDLDGDGEPEVFTARTEEGGEETIIDVRSVSQGDRGAEFQTRSYDDFLAEQQQQYNPDESRPPFEEMGGGGCQRPGYYPVFVDGAATGNCASITHFNDFFVEPIGGSSALIAFPSFEEIYGELPEGATTWQIGDFDGDGVREVYAMDADGNPHTVYNTDDSGNVTSNPYAGDETTEDPALGELIATHGREAVEDAQRKLKELEAILGKTIDDPLGTLEGIIQKTKTSSSGSNCGFVSVPGGTGIEEWVLDCATVGVGIPIPFPIPGPLGSIFKGATVREIKDAIENAGYEMGKVLRGETPIDEVFDKIVDGVVTKVQDIFKDADEISVDSILGTIGDILVGGGYILAGDLYDEYFKDKINSVIPNVPIIPFDSSQECQDSDRYTLDADGNCGDCIDPNKEYDLNEGKCVEVEVVDPNVDENGCKEGAWDGTKCVCPEGTDRANLEEDIDGKCSDVGDEGGVDGGGEVTPDDTECSEAVPVLPYATLVDRQIAWNQKCVPQGWCPASPGVTPTLALDHEDGDCGRPLITDGNNGTTPVDDCPEGTVQCPHGTFGPDGSSCAPSLSDCTGRGDGDDVIVTPPDDDKPYKCDGYPQTSEQIEQCSNEGWTQCPNDRELAGEWIKPGASVDLYCGALVVVGTDPVKPDEPPEGCSNGAIDPPWDGGTCSQCPEGQQMVNDMCTPRYTCPDPNATVNSDGSCGPCKQGYVFDGGLERCVQEAVTDPCENPAYAAANPTQCGTPAECNDCTCAEYAAANPDECGPGPEEPPVSSSRGGGGGMFSPQSAGGPSMGDPQLLARMEFPIVDYLSESLAKQTKNDLMSGMLTGNIV